MKRTPFLALFLAIVLLLTASGCAAQPVSVPSAPDGSVVLAPAPVKKSAASAADKAAPAAAKLDAEAKEPAAGESGDEEEIPAEKEEKVTDLYIVTMPMLSNGQYGRTLLLKLWKEIEPNIKLHFVERDYASTAYPDEADVLVIDAENAVSMIRNGCFAEIDPEGIDCLDKLMPIDTSFMTQDGKLYGVPWLLCGYYLIYHKDDAEMAEVETLEELCEVLEAGNVEGLPVRRDPDKIWTSFGSEYDFLALNAMMDMNGEYQFIDYKLVGRKLHDLYQSFCDVAPYTLETWDGFPDSYAFARGRGRAMLSYSEILMYTYEPEDKFAIKTISLGGNTDVALNYVDSAFISDRVKTGTVKYEKCLELVDLLTSYEYISNLLTYRGNMQYFTPARADVFEDYAAESGLYASLYELLKDAELHPFCFNKSGSDHIFTMIDSYIGAQDDTDTTRQTRNLSQHFQMNQTR